MKMLMISANTLRAAPSGPANVAGALRQAGHTVDLTEFLFKAPGKASPLWSTSDGCILKTRNSPKGRPVETGRKL
jgi:hypothetical protein